LTRTTPNFVVDTALTLTISNAPGMLTIVTPFAKYAIRQVHLRKFVIEATHDAQRLLGPRPTTRGVQVVR
jgi:hypothetical protein